MELYKSISETVQKQKTIIGRAFRDYVHQSKFMRPSQAYREKIASHFSNKEEFKSHADTLLSDGILILPQYIQADHLHVLKQEYDIAMNQTTADATGSSVVTSLPFSNSEAFGRFMFDPYLLGLTLHYFGQEIYLAQISANRVEPYQYGDYDSYQWHHDAVRNQIKFMLLLTDLASDGQAMQYIPKTNSIFHPLASYEETRFSTAEALSYGREPVICSGLAGTVIVFDTNGIHRGTRGPGPRRDVITPYFTTGNYLQHLRLGPSFSKQIPFLAGWSKTGNPKISI